VALSGEANGGVIQLEALLRGQQQARFQAHSIQALRCTIARTLLARLYPILKGRRGSKLRGSPASDFRLCLLHPRR
jgi:hypothetical protein